MTKLDKQAKRKDALEQLETLFDERFAAHIHKCVLAFEGQFPTLENAIGALIMGRLMGWRVLYLLHSRRTINKFEKVLNLKFKGKAPWDESQDVMRPVGPFAEMSNAFLISQKMGEFWKIVRNDIAVPREEKEKFLKSL